jgi:hypothetical protein
VRARASALSIAAAVGVAFWLQLAIPASAWADDSPILVNDSTDVTLTKADNGTATATVTIENQAEAELEVWVRVGATAADDCTIVSPTKGDPEEILGHRHEKVTVTFAAACDPEREGGTDFIVRTDAGAETFRMHAKPPATSDPNWPAILTIYALVGVVSTCLLGAVWSLWEKKHIPEGNSDNPPNKGGQPGMPQSKVVMTLPGLDAAWKFADSWAANATVVTAVFTGVFGAKEIVTALLGDAGKTLITTATVAAAISVGLAGVSPMLLQSLRRRVSKRDEVGAGAADDPKLAEVPAGLYVTPLGLLVAGTLTLTATGGQLGVILYELSKTDFWHWWASIVAGIVAAALLIWYAIAATSQNLTTGATRALAKPKSEDEDAAVAARIERLRAAAVRNVAADDVRIVVVPLSVPAPVPAAEVARPAAIL